MRSENPWRSALRHQPWIWLALAGVYFVFDQGRQPDPQYLELAARCGLWALTGALVTLVAGLIWARLRIRRLLMQLSGAIGFSALASLIWMVLFVWLQDLLAVEGHDNLFDWPREQFFGEWIDHALITLIWHGWLFAQVQQQYIAEAQRQADTAQLQLLRSRLEPHFFFNALNTAMALTREAPQAAEQVLLDLSALLRQSLNLGQATVTDLRAELALVQRYLAIETARFEEKLQIDYDIDVDALGAPVPPFLLQPLVNNAVKHGMRTSPMPLRICIIIKTTARGVRIEISNTGRLSESSAPGHGIGTRNLAARLEAERPGRHRFELTESDDRVRAQVEVW